MAFTVVRKMLGAEQPSPVLPRSDQAKAPCPHSTAGSTLAQSFSLWCHSLKLCNLEGTERGRGREMGGTSQDLLCARMSTAITI
uniref:Uncharacterized protein n=1 Tax=Ursus maritimus TaxID=29073 RepID=A0A452T9M9_URSMA